MKPKLEVLPSIDGPQLAFEILITQLGLKRGMLAIKADGTEYVNEAIQFFWEAFYQSITANKVGN